MTMDTLPSAETVKAELQELATPARAAASQRYFKTGPGQYGAGDIFIGVTVPDGRKVARANRDLALAEIEKLAASPIHEHRLCALHLLVEKFKRGNAAEREQIVEFYLGLVDAGRVNNWDLVDTSAPYILGGWLIGRDPSPLLQLAANQELWHRRVGIMGTFGLIAAGESSIALKICESVLDDKRDLIHKAAGWMLREIGARVSKAELRAFLESHSATMPRTMLRYAIEHFDADERKRWMSVARQSRSTTTGT